MKGLRFLVVAVLLGAAAFAAGQGSEYLEPDFTECWGCHAPGLWNPDMDPNYVVTPLQAKPEVGQEFELRAELLNAWLGEQRDMAVTLDISDAPSLRFVGGKDPLLGVTTDGQIDVEPGMFDPGSPTDPFFTKTSRGSAAVVVPEGATDIRIVLEPHNTDPTTGPKITMRVFDARTDRDGRPTETVAPDGPGASTRFVVNGASEVASHGFGNWTIEGEVQPISGSGDVDPQVEPVGFTVTVDAWFNATEAVQQVASRPGPVQPGAKALFSWQLQMVSAPGDRERIEVVANATTYYKHDDVNNPNFVNTTVNTTAPVETQADGGFSVGLETLGGGGTVVPAVEGVGIDRISEVVGYVSAVLLLSSIWTGGIFGKASRRQLNVIFGSARRRVAFHNVLSYGIIAAATVHTFIFLYDINGPLAEDGWPWLLGIIWGSPAVLGMIGLGVTGALQVPMIRRWNYGTWRWIHFGLAIATMVFTLVHMLLDGANFTALQNSIGYQDPLTA